MIVYARMYYFQAGMPTVIDANQWPINQFIRQLLNYFMLIHKSELNNNMERDGVFLVRTAFRVSALFFFIQVNIT